MSERTLRMANRKQQDFLIVIGAMFGASVGILIAVIGGNTTGDIGTWLYVAVPLGIFIGVALGANLARWVRRRSRARG
ncbi:MAG: hypothetical protein ACETWG_03550 [Candidatus Neomarinimicrobiota bacterium]